MAPKGTGGRTVVAATSSGGGRTSSRIAEKQEAAQQAEREAAEAAAEAAAQITREPSPDTAMPPPSSTRGRGRGRSRGLTDSHARRGTTRGNRGGSSIASYSARNTPSTSVVYALDGHDDVPYTPQRVDAATIVYGESWREASELTPRTRDATANLMNKFVDRLYAVAKDLIRHLQIPSDERDESWGPEFRTHKEIFHTFYKIYTMETDVFIDIDAVAEKSKAADVPLLWDRMVKSVASANLASLLSDVEDLDGDRSNVLNRLPLLQRIDDHFPATFTPGGAKGLVQKRQWIVDMRTMDQALTIRTKRFVETLRGFQQVNHWRLFANVFLNLDVDTMTDEEITGYIDTADLKPFAAFDVNDPELSKYRDTIRGFRSMLEEMDVSTFISKMDQQNPFEEFLQVLKEWIRLYENRAPGPSRPNAFGYHGDSPFAADAQLQAEARASQQASHSMSGYERLRQHLAANDAAHTLDADNDMHSQSLGFVGSEGVGSIAGTDAEVIARSHALDNQNPFFMAGNEGSIFASAATMTSKPRDSRKRGRKRAGSGDETAKRPRVNDHGAMPPSASAPAAPMGPLPPGSAVFDPVALSRQSQLISKANRRPAQPKQRKPWTAHDTQQLVRAVDVYKAKWSTIEKAIREKHIPFNVPERDQQGLRDKARLVKVDILKTDGALPPAFDLVVLGRKEKDMVIAAGRNPERREEDVDENGQLLNTLFDLGAPGPIQDGNGNADAHDIAHENGAEVHNVMHQEPPPPPEQQQQQQQQQQQIVQEGSDVHELAPLQAQMVAEAPMDRVPDAPMMAADMDGPGAPPSESLGEAQSVIESVAPPVDPSIVEPSLASEAVEVVQG
ncbi:hypothetical protein BD289DRAFT_449648 [Coniella lustricola]|uniref:Myb-like domain-containing protein n=1 Tax=Coniella lustricola TaxID=2025994 RepID=A0A2T3ALL1_9PEZI|nr:hypothetical protein BD289DRAFT_449648 [Coniella lustricola]